jgi:hypothetical protein
VKMACYFDHRDEILALIAEEELAHAQFRRRMFSSMGSKSLAPVHCGCDGPVRAR